MQKLTVSKLTIPISCALVFFFALVFAPKPSKAAAQPSILYSNPTLIKASSGFFAPIMADLLWLKSTHIGEMSKTDSYLVDTQEFARAFMTISALDPNFYPAIGYGSMFLASVANKPDAALAIIDSCQKRTNDDRLKFLKINILHTYKNDHARSVKLARELLSSAQKFGVISPAFSYDYLVSLIAFDASNAQKKAMVIEDLRELEKKTKNPAQKAAIKAKLDVLL
jgi:hypothetical protein